MPVKIEDNVWVGAKVVGTGCIIGASSVVTK